MGSWTIYSKNRTPKYTVKELEYHDTWMGEEYVTVSITSPTPLELAIGDYLVYRGLTYSVYSVPGALKQARRNTYGEAFVYENIKLSARGTELTDIRFLDYVLNDNNIHYTSLPTFAFYAETVDDLLDRLQANTDREGVQWLFISPSYNRTMQRYEQGTAAYQEAAQLWEQYFGGSHEDPVYEKTNVNISIDKQSVWDGLAPIKNDFGLNFFSRERAVIVGGEGMPAEHIFRYGKGNGLYQIERVADQDQKVTTKLYAYGSDKNLPIRYYANITRICFAYLYARPSVDSNILYLDFVWNRSYVTGAADSEGKFPVVVSIAGVTYNVKAYPMEVGARTLFTIEASVSLGFVTRSMEIDFVSGIDKDKFPASNIRQESGALPNNMAVQVLMLPGFPQYSLADLCRCTYNGEQTVLEIRKTPSASYNEFMRIEGNHPVTFSNDPLQPYILSGNIDTIGIKEGDVHFVEDNDDNGLKEIYPSIEGMTRGDVEGTSSTERLDEIVSCDVIQDNGVFGEGVTIQNFNLMLKDIGFNLKEAFDNAGQNMIISMKDGYCGGRDFTVHNVTANANGTWTLNVERSHDEGLDLWFPYSTNAAIGQTPTADEPYQIRTGDHFVLTEIEIGDTSYIWAAAMKMLRKSITYLLNNDYTRFTYLPKVDEIYMARQHDESQTQAGIESLHDTLKSGMLMLFEDEDLDVDGSVFIDSLTIKENGNNGIPTYDVVLRNDKQVGTMQRIQNQINSITSYIGGVGGGGGGLSVAQIRSLISSYGAGFFLSKLVDDTAQGVITFVKGLVSKARALFEGDVDIQGLLRGSRAQLNTIKSDDFTGDGMADTGWKITNAYNGHSKMTIDELYVRMKAVFESLEIKERKVSGGDLTFTAAANVIVRTDYLDGYKQILGYDTVKVPWFLENGSDFFMTNRQLLDIFSREARIKRSFDELDDGVKLRIRYVRCYFLAEDGDGNEVYNMWQVGDLVRCQTFNMQKQEREGGVNGRDIPSEDGEHSYSRQQNTFWWRKCVAVDSEPTTIDGRKYHWFDVACNLYAESRAMGNLSYCALGSDIPCAGDNACQFGNTSNPERMNAISIEINGSGNSDAPAIKMYRGIYTFDLKKCWWGGETTRKGMWSPSAGFEVYAPLFKFVTEYGTYREPINRGSWQSIPREQDDYGNSVQYEGDDEPTQMVRKCYYYNEVSHNGSMWLCTMANDSFHWVDAYGRYISDSDYNALSEEQKAQCSHVQNYTTDEPSSDSPNWTLQVSKGDPGAFKSSVFCRTNTTPSAPSNEKRDGYNTYTHPVPPPVSGQPTWTDGVRDGSAKLWMSTAWFYSDGTHDNWTTPQPQTDTQTQDIEFCPLADYTPIPESSPVGADRRSIGWYDPERDKNRLPSGTTWEDMIWRAERKKSNGEYAGAWVYSRVKGENAVRIDLTNENDSMLYTSGGTLVSGNVTSVATLFDGATDVSDKTTWTITSSGCTVSSGNSRNIVVTGMTNTTGYVSVKAEYTDKGGTKHTVTARLNIKKIVDGDKYDLDISPNAIAYNITKDDPAATTLTIRVWKTSVNSSGGVTRTLSAPPSGYYVYANGTRLTASATGTYSYTTDNSQISDVTVKIAPSASATDFLDLETIPVNKAEDGENGKGGANAPYLHSHTTLWALSNNGNTAPSSGWSSSRLTPSINNKYLWRKDIYEYDANDRGRNLLRGTRDLQVGRGTWSDGSVRMSGSSSHGTISRDTTQTLPVTGIDSCIKINKTGGNTSELGFAQDQVPLTAGRKIMMSCWIKGTAGAQVRLQPAWTNNTGAGSKAYTCNGEWQYVTCEGTLGNYSSWSAGYVYLNTQGATAYVCALKLEYGEDVTDWMPAPEDLYREEVSIWSVYGDSPKITIGADHYWYVDGQLLLDADGNPVKAEGEDGTGVEIKGSVDVIFNSQKTGTQTSLEGISNPEIGQCYIVDSNRHLYIYNGTEPYKEGVNPQGWKDLGEFKGEPGHSSYMHMAWADEIIFISGTSEYASVKTNGQVGHIVTVYDGKNHDWIGFCVDESPTDPGDSGWKSYKWNYQKGTDGDGYEYVYYRTTVNTPPLLDESATDSNGHTKTDDEYLPRVTNGGSIGGYNYKDAISGYETDDDPHGISEQWPFEWEAVRKRKNGVWGAFSAMALHRNWADSIKGDATPVLLFSKNPIVFQGSAFGQSVNTSAISSQVVVLAGNSGYTPTSLVLSDIPSGVNVSKSGTTISVSPKNIGVAESALAGSVKVTATYDGGKTAVGYLTLAVSRQGSVKYIAVKGECWHGTSVPQGSFEICSGISENTYNTQGRGLTLLVVRKSDLSIAYGPVSFDTYGDDGSGNVACNNLATTIRGYNEDYFICLASMDAVGWSDNLIEALIEYGSNGVEVTIRGRYPFVFVGYKGLSRGYAIQKQGVLEGNAVEAVAYISGEKLTSTRNGEIGRNFWYAGVYDASKTYEVTQNAAPFVSYEGNYYVRIGDGLKTTGKTPGPNSTYWELMTSQFNYLITQAIFSTYAQLGSWVFNSDYMFSAKDASGQSRGSQEYDGMTDAKKTSGFIPAVAMDAANGRASFSGDKVRFNPKGSGWLANQNITWDENGNASFKGTIHATDGDFEGKITSTDGTIGGFSIGTKDLTNTSYDASIVIQNAASNPTQITRVGKSAVDSMTNQSCSLQAESKGTGTYNTALYLNAEKATYNYAFHGNGNGVLNGLMFGYKTQYKTIPSGSTDRLDYIYLKDGATTILKGTHSSGHVIMASPSIREVRQCLGLSTSDTTTPFAIEVTYINLSDYTEVHIGFRGNTLGGTLGTEYPFLMNNDNHWWTTSLQIAQGDLIKLMLLYAPSSYGTGSYEYRAQVVVRQADV